MSGFFKVGDVFAHPSKPGIVWTVTRIRGRWPPHDIDMVGDNGQVDCAFELDVAEGAVMINQGPHPEP